MTFFQQKSARGVGRKRFRQYWGAELEDHGVSQVKIRGFETSDAPVPIDTIFA